MGAAVGGDAAPGLPVILLQDPSKPLLEREGDFNNRESLLATSAFPVTVLIESIKSLNRGPVFILASPQFRDI